MTIPYLPGLFGRPEEDDRPFGLFRPVPRSAREREKDLKGLLPPVRVTAPAP